MITSFKAMVALQASHSVELLDFTSLTLGFFRSVEMFVFNPRLAYVPSGLLRVTFY